MTDIPRLIAAFDEARSPEAERAAALAMRNALAEMLKNEPDPSDVFPYGEGFGDYDLSVYGTRPRDVLKGRAVLRKVTSAREAAERAGVTAARKANERASAMAWFLTFCILGVTLLGLALFAPQRTWEPMDADTGAAPVSAAR